MPTNHRLVLIIHSTLWNLIGLDSEGATFKDGVRRGPTEAFKVEKLSNVDAITVKCFVEETMDVSDGNTYFEWKVSNELIQQWKSAQYKKVFHSPRFNAVG
eukprot:610103_1